MENVSNGNRNPLEPFPVLLGLALVSLMIPVPRPAFIPSMPWKAELAISAVLATASFALLFRKRRLFDQTVRTSTLQKLILGAVLAFAAVSALSVTWAEFPIAATHHSLVWLSYFCILYFAYRWIAISGSLRTVTIPFVVAVTIVLALCVFDLLTFESFAEFEGTFRIRYARFGEMAVTAGPLLLGCAIADWNRKRAGLIALFAAAAWLIAMLSLSKAAFVAGLAGFLFVLFGLLLFGRRTLRTRSIAALAVFASVTIAIQFGTVYLTAVPSTANYISGEADPTRSTSAMRIFTWTIGLEMVRNNTPLGVGGDNFGPQFNDSRLSYAARNPDDPSLATAEDYLVERAHNEYLQIAAEFGVLGILFIGACLLWFGVTLAKAVWTQKGRVSPVLIGSAGGLVAFAVSSAFTSFSFRAFQNGVVFFIVLAVFVHSIRRVGQSNSDPSGGPEKAVSEGFLVRLRKLSALPFAALFLFSIAAGASQYYVLLGEKARSQSEAEAYFRSAIGLHPENTGAYLAYAGRAGRSGDTRLAAELYRKAIDNGLGVTVTYSTLSKAYELDGDRDNAERALAEAISIFPRSVFIRIRYALLLEANGKGGESAKQFDAARAMDLKQANGWETLIRDGMLKAHLRAKEVGDSTPPAELRPNNAIYAYADEQIGPSSPAP
ncbi:MAG: O-antigen ligase family protein [Acidobacteria bacterium]|nr:O-antigen ligase family protein [Acidobacteriota bacterium]